MMLRRGGEPATAFFAANVAVSSEGVQQPHRHLQTRIQAVVSNEGSVGTLRNEIIRPTVPRGYLDHRQPPLYSIFLDFFVFAFDGRNLRLEFWIGSDLGRRWRLRHRHRLELRRRWCWLSCGAKRQPQRDDEQQARKAGMHGSEGAISTLILADGPLRVPGVRNDATSALNGRCSPRLLREARG